VVEQPLEGSNVVLNEVLVHDFQWLDRALLEKLSPVALLLYKRRVNGLDVV